MSPSAIRHLIAVVVSGHKYSLTNLLWGRDKNDCHFADDIFKFNFLYKNWCILIQILLKFVVKGPINNMPALVQIIAQCWTGNKSLSEPLMA